MRTMWQRTGEPRGDTPYSLKFGAVRTAFTPNFLAYFLISRFLSKTFFWLKIAFLFFRNKVCCKAVQPVQC